MAGLKRFRVFYSFDKSDRGLPAEQALAMDDAAIQSMLRQLSENGGFVGLLDARDRTLQVAHELDSGKYWIEIPSPERRGSFGQLVGLDQLTALFDALPGELTPGAFPEFEFQSWD